MKIGILSDSHSKIDYTNQAVELLKQNGVQYLIHAGDLCHEENLQLLKKSELTYVSVFGNNDNHLTNLSQKYNLFQEPYYFKIKNYKFKLMHLPYYLSPDTDIIIFGHTHIFEHQYKNKTLFINPGEVCAREKPISECAILEIKQNQYIITHYYKQLNKKNPKWETKEFIYEK
jgi:putative phosphoesterase